MNLCRGILCHNKKETGQKKEKLSEIPYTRRDGLCIIKVYYKREEYIMDYDERFRSGDEFDDEEYERRRRARMMRRRQERLRQIRRRKLMRIVAMAGVLVLAIFLIAKGVTALTSGFGKRKPTEISKEVKAETKKGEIPAARQPVMSASDIQKLSGDMTIFGWQTDETGKWYRNADGTFFEAGWKEIDGAKYYFDENGYVKTGWLELDGKDYYFDEEGRYDSSKVRPMVALTYDDGPGKYTDKLLDCLEENNAKATFFMLGENAERYPDIVKRIYDSGMELGNHTYDHQMLPSLSSEEISDEIGKTNSIIENAAGVPADSLRPPGGSFNESVQELAGMPIVKWSLDTKDWKTKNADATYQKTMDNVQDGSVVLMHDIHESSVEASLRLIPELVEKGYKLVTVQELAEAKGIDLEDGEVYYYFGEGTQEVE